MKRFTLLALLVAAFCAHRCPTSCRAEVTVEKSESGAVVKIDGSLFTEYVCDFHGTPILWPIHGPTGKEMTRRFPMDDANETEKKDHVHHRSLWFTHGDVDRLTFWHKEKIEHREFVKLEGGPRCGVIETRNVWLAPDGKELINDERQLAFGGDDHSRWIDFNITLEAADQPVKLGDTKEGCLGIRVPGTMKVDAKKGGEIINSHGQKDRDAWGKQAPWVDYHGPVEDETLGIAIMNHPSSFRFPTYWHVRTYGLFAANPFGLHHFTPAKKDGSHTLTKAEPITFRYRILFHSGDEHQGKVGEAFESYAKEQKTSRND